MFDRNLIFTVTCSMQKIKDRPLPGEALGSSNGG
jgi:hypothetical protein